jgi:hypothetical protein
MKKIVMIFSMMFAIFTLNAEEAIKGYDDGMQYKSGTQVDFSFEGVQINIESASEQEYSAKIMADDRAGNLFGHVWQIEGPEGMGATMIFTIDKSLLLKNELPDDIYVSRVHDGYGYLIPQENIAISENETSYVISITHIDQFSIWGLFDSNPPVPTLSEWALILFIGLLAGVGGWFVWKRA